MPKLLQGGTYTAQIPDLQISGGRRAEGVSALGSSAGRAIQQVGSAFLEEMEQREQRRAIVEHAKLRQKYAKQLEEAELSGADVNQIRENLENEVANLGSTTSTRVGLETAEQYGANTLNLFDTAVNQINVRRAASEATLGMKDFVSAQSELLTQNPSYLPIAEGEATRYLETFKGRIPPEKLAEMQQALRQQVNVHAVASLIRIAPEDALKRLNAGEFDLTPEQRIQELGRADAQIRAIRAERAAERAEADYERKRTSDGARDEWFKEIMAGTPNILRQIIGDLRLTPEHREHLVVFHENWLKAKLGADKQSDPTVVRDLMLAIHAPEGSPRKIYTDDTIYTALQDGKLSIVDFRMLKSEVANARDPNNSAVSRRFGEAMNVVSNAIRSAPEFVAQPDLQSSIILSWAAAVRDRMEEERKAGRNPARLFDPADKDSVVRREYIAQFVAAARQEKADVTKAKVQSQVKPGDVLNGYEFISGNPGNPASWRKTDKPDTITQEIVSERLLTPRFPVFGGVTVPPAQSRSDSVENRIRRQYPRRRHESERDYVNRIARLTNDALAAGAQ